MIEEVQSHYEEAKPFILEQYKEATKWNACLKAVLDQYDDVENYAWNIASITDLLGFSGELPTGGKLDFIGGLVGLSRNTSESDSDYYSRIIDYINSNDSGTIEGIIKRAISIVQTNEVTYIEENSGFPFVASGLIITLSERQITRAEANRMKAAGTRLFVGGFLTTHDGIPLSTNSGHLIACAGGPYDTIEVEPEIEPSFHVWDGSRDYSFYNASASTWYIETPEQWAALCMISLGMDVADGSGLSNAKGAMHYKNIEVTEDLYFNENYTENFTWETTYQNDSEKDILNNFAYVLRADGQRVALYLEANCNSFNGNFHKIIGMYASSYSWTRWHKGIIAGQDTNVMNISFEYCTLKNGMTRAGNAQANYFPSLLYDDTNNATYKNIRAFHCKTIGVCTGNYIGRGFLVGTTPGIPAVSGIMHNLSVQNCQAMLNFSNSTYYERHQHAFIFCGSRSKNFKFIHTFENENLVTSQPLHNTYQVYMSDAYPQDKLRPPASESYVYTFGNIGTTTVNETSILQTMSSKAALIAQVNADITANASGDLSLLDANGNFTGVCP